MTSTATEPPDTDDLWDREPCCSWCGTLANIPCDCAEFDPFDVPTLPGRATRERRNGDGKRYWLGCVACGPKGECNAGVIGRRPRGDRYKDRRR